MWKSGYRWQDNSEMNVKNTLNDSDRNLLAWRLTEGHSEYGTENLSFIKDNKVTVWLSDCQLLKTYPFALHYITACLLVCGNCLLLSTQLAK